MWYTVVLQIIVIKVAEMHRESVRERKDRIKVPEKLARDGPCGFETDTHIQLVFRSLLKPHPPENGAAHQEVNAFDPRVSLDLRNRRHPTAPPPVPSDIRESLLATRP